MAQRAGGAQLRSLPRQWTSDGPGRGSSPSQARIRSGETGAGYIKKSHKHLFARKAMKYQFMAQHRHEYPVTLMCRVLEVSVSGYYAWSKRLPSQHSREDADLAEQVKSVFQ